MKNYIVSIISVPAIFKCTGIETSESNIDKKPGKDSIELLINNLLILTSIEIFT